MSTEMIWQTVSTSSGETEKLASALGGLMSPPAVVELRSDLGGGKTTFAKGLARGLGSKCTVSSPTFTLSQVYKFPSGQMAHFDFYRLDRAGIMVDELAESLKDNKTITVIEWAKLVTDILPADRLSIELKPSAENPGERKVVIKHTKIYLELIEKLNQIWPRLEV